MPVAVVPVEAVPPALAVAFVDGPGVCTGPESLPPFQYGAQGLLSVAPAAPGAVAEARRAMRTCQRLLIGCSQAVC